VMRVITREDVSPLVYSDGHYTSAADAIALPK
jgi:hypothetical protein